MAIKQTGILLHRLDLVACDNSVARLSLPTSNNYYHDRLARVTFYSIVHISIIKVSTHAAIILVFIVNISHLPFTRSLSRTTIPNIYTCIVVGSLFILSSNDMHTILTFTKPTL